MFCSPGYGVGNAVAIDPVDERVVYVGGDQDFGGSYGPVVCKTTDDGATWHSLYSGLEGWSVQALAVNHLRPSAVYAGTLGGLSRSSDGGMNWDRCSGWHIRALALDPVDTAVIYMGTRNGGIQVSTDGGVNWAYWNDGLNCLDVYTLVVDPTPPARVYAGTGAGSVSVRSSVGIEESARSDADHRFALEPARPSLARGRTVIRYQIPAEGYVSLAVCDLSGSLVRTLVRAPMQPGRHSVNWDGTDGRGYELPAGVYFVRLDAGGTHLDRKVVLAE
jgi:hypothetical protein